MDCVICKLVKGELDHNKVYGDDEIFAFLDIRPNNPGHTLICPKKHYQDLLDMPDELLSKLILVSKKLSKAIVDGVKADGFNIIQNNKAAAGQVVMHYHMHIVPRFPNDGFKHWQGKSTTPEELNKVKEKIVSFLKE